MADTAVGNEKDSWARRFGDVQTSGVVLAGLTAALLAGCGTSESGSSPGLGQVLSYSCGNVALTTQQIDRDLLVTLDDRIYRLSPGVAGAGVRYSGGTPSAPVVFHTEGQTANFSIGFRSLPTCRQLLVAEGSPEQDGAPAGSEVASTGASSTDTVPALPGAPTQAVSTVEPAVPVEPAVLVGPEWRVEEIAGVPVLDRTRTTLEFHNDGSLGGFASCNSYRSSFESSERGGPGTLSLGEIVTTRKGCPGPLMQQERDFLRVLSAAIRYEVRPDGRLAIETADGQTLIAQRN